MIQRKQKYCIITDSFPMFGAIKFIITGLWISRKRSTLQRSMWPIYLSQIAATIYAMYAKSTISLKIEARCCESTVNACVSHHSYSISRLSLHNTWKLHRGMYMSRGIEFASQWKRELNKYTHWYCRFYTPGLRRLAQKSAGVFRWW